MKIPNKKRAVAPVIATLLMIAVAVAMSVIIFMWSQGFLSQTSSSTGGQQGSQNQAAQSSISVELATFTPCPTGGCVAGAPPGISPIITIVVRNVGAVAVSLGSLTVTGISSNSGFKGTYQIAQLVYASTAMTSSESACAPNEVVSTSSGSITIGKGTSATITINPNTTTPCSVSGRIFSGDVVNIKITTSAGTFAQSQFTVP